MTNSSANCRLTLGPVLFNWPAETWRDFYFRIADEAPVNVVYLGEVVCSKREPFFLHYMEEVANRLQKAGKDVVFSSLALVMKKRELQGVRDLIEGSEFLIEANDTSALHHLSGKPHVVGPYINVYNEPTMLHLARQGAQRICLPFEMEDSSIEKMAGAARDVVDMEVQIFGRTPLALSARCYHARAHHLHKDNCQFICSEDPDGLDLKTMDEQPFLSVNGIQTMSHACLERSGAITDLSAIGVSCFRMSPQDCDMVFVAGAYRDLLDDKRDLEQVRNQIETVLPSIPKAAAFYARGNSASKLKQAG